MPAEVVMVAGSGGPGTPADGVATGFATPSVADWRLAVEARARRVKADLATMDCDAAGEPYQQVALAALEVVDHVLAVSEAPGHSFTSWWTGWHIQRAWRALHDAEVNVAAAGNDLGVRLPALRERVEVHLHGDDLRRRALDQLRPATPPTSADRAVVVDALRGAFDASDDAHWGARALRNKLIVTGAVLALLNVLVGALYALRPGLVPMCVALADGGGQGLVCPSGSGHAQAADLWLVQLLGVFGATVGAIVWLVRRRPSLSPYVLTGYLALIKVLMGAALAVVGVLALSAGVVRGLANVGSPAALLLWAALLGYSQEAGTRLLDNYADRVMNRARPLEESAGNDR
jgi:hypothetical protein